MFRKWWFWVQFGTYTVAMGSWIMPYAWFMITNPGVEGVLK